MAMENELVFLVANRIQNLPFFTDNYHEIFYLNSFYACKKARIFALYFQIFKR
jgi:hypothetical protein